MPDKLRISLKILALTLVSSSLILSVLIFWVASFNEFSKLIKLLAGMPPYKKNFLICHHQNSSSFFQVI